MLGDPVEHSRSPPLHNGLLRARGHNALYLAIPAPRGCLASLLPALWGLPFDGLNLTYPLKEEAVPLCEALEGDAADLLAVNTLARGEDGWVGSSTDGEGLLLALRELAGFLASGRRVVVLGAGGAARSAIRALARTGPAALVVATRDAARFEAPFFVEARAAGLTPRTTADPALGDDLEAADLVVHATPFGLGGGGGAPPWPLERLRPGCRVVDMNYDLASPTPFLEALPDGPAREDGRGMLAGQAVLAFERWTGERPSLGEALEAGGLGAA